MYIGSSAEQHFNLMDGDYFSKFSLLLIELSTNENAGKGP